MMNFVTPHAILISKENIWTIHSTIGMDYSVASSLLEEYDEKSYYLIGWRELTNGLPVFDVMSKDEFFKKYKVLAPVDLLNHDFTSIKEI